MSKTFENSGSEKGFLKIYSNEELDKYAKPSVTVDSVIFRYFEGRVQTLLLNEATTKSIFSHVGMIFSFDKQGLDSSFKIAEDD